MFFQKVILLTVLSLFGAQGISASFAEPCLPLSKTIPPTEDTAHLISKYRRFHEIAKEAKRFYHSLDSQEQEALQNLLRVGNTDEAVQNSLIQQIRKSPVISSKQKTHLIQSLGLNEKDPAVAMESFRRHYEYFFWTDHSATHLSDVLAASQHNALTWPKAYVAPYQEVLQDPRWSKQISKAIELHDSLMPEGRTLHADLLLKEDLNAFPKDWSAAERNTSSVLALLHSKTLLPYSELPHWDQIVASEIIPKLQNANHLSAARAAELKTWMSGLNDSEKKNMALSAAWIRMADANRPIGKGLRNSAGDFFFLDPKTGQLMIDQKLPVPVTRSQIHEIYGSVALNNLKIVSLPENAFAAQFLMNLPKAQAKLIGNELNKLPLLTWIEAGTWKREVELLSTSPEVRSSAAVLCSILADFPPLSFRKIEIIP